MIVILIIIGKILLILIPILIGIYFAIKKDFKRILIPLFILMFISAPMTVKEIIDFEKLKEKLANIELLLSETRKQLLEVEYFNEFLLEKQELRSKGFTEEYIEYLRISPIASHHAIKGSKLYSKGQFKEAIYNFQEVLKNPIIKQGEYQDVLITTNWIIANCYVSLGDLKEALNYYQKLLSLSEAISERSKSIYAKATSLVAVGFIKSKLSDKDKEEAITILDEAYDLLESIDMNFSISGFDFPSTGVKPSILYYKALALRYIGRIFCDQNKPYEGLSQYLHALELYEFEKEIRLYSIMSVNLLIGNIYNNLCETKKAEKYYLNILQLNQEIEDNPDLLKNETFYQKESRLVCIGRAFYSLNKHQEALKKFEEVLELNLKIERNYGIANSLVRIGNLYLNSNSINNMQVAKQKYLKALDYAIHINDENLIESIKEKLDIIGERIKN